MTSFFPLTGAGSLPTRRLFRSRCRPMLPCRKLSVRVHILRCRGCFIFLFFFYGILPHWRLHFLPVLTGRKRNKGRNSRPRFRPKISPRRLPPRNSLPAVAQTSAPAEWAGSCTSIERKYADGADPPRGACVGAHQAKEISFALLSFFAPFGAGPHSSLPWEFHFSMIHSVASSCI